MPSRSSSSTRSSGSASGSAVAPGPGGVGVEVVDSQAARSSPATAWNGMSRVCDSQYVVNTSTPRLRASRARFANEASLADARRSHARRYAPAPPIASRGCAVRVLISHVRPTNVSTPCRRPVAVVTAIQAGDGGYRIVGALDAHHFRFAQHGGVLDQPGGGLAEHHAARRRHRLHPLRHPDLLADGGVAQRARADLTGDHLAGIQSRPARRIHPVAASTSVASRAAFSWMSRPPDRRVKRGPPTRLAHRTPP